MLKKHVEETSLTGTGITALERLILEIRHVEGKKRSIGVEDQFLFRVHICVKMGVILRVSSEH